MQKLHSHRPSSVERRPILKSHNFTPLDRARRQLSEALWLFFEGRDPLVVETLAEEARANLHEQLEGSPAEIRAGFVVRYIRDEHHDAANAFMAGDPEASEVQGLLFDAVTLYLHLSKEWILEAAAFFSWMQLEQPGWFRPEFVSVQGIEERRGDRAYFLTFLRDALQNGPGEDGTKLGRHVPEIEWGE